MANSTQPESKAETALPQSLLDSFKSKDRCPRCKKEFLQTAYLSHEMRRRRFVGITYGSEAEAEGSDTLAKGRDEPYDVPYGSDKRSLVEIMNHFCVKCGHAFAENEDQQKRRKEQEKDDKPSNPWDGGLLILFTMLAVILAINLERDREPAQNAQPLNAQPAVTRNDGEF